MIPAAAAGGSVHPVEEPSATACQRGAGDVKGVRLQAGHGRSPGVWLAVSRRTERRDKTHSAVDRCQIMLLDSSWFPPVGYVLGIGST